MRSVQLLVITIVLLLHVYSTNLYADTNIKHDQYTEFWQADYISSSEPVPPVGDADWYNVDLPHYWARDNKHPEDSSWGWYRIEIPARLHSDHSGSVYFWRLIMNVDVYFNDEHLGNGGHMDEPVSRNWNRPLIFDIPETAWFNNQQNYLFIHLRSQQKFGILAPVFVGNKNTMHTMWSQRSFVQNTLSQIFFILTLVIASYALLLWVRRKEPMLLYFSASAYLWSIFSLYLFIRDVTFMDDNMFWRFTHWCIDAWVVMLVFFTHRLLGIKPIWLERSLIIFLICTAILYPLPESNQFIRFTHNWHIVTAFISLYLTIRLFYAGYTTGNRQLLLFAFGCSLILILGIRDLTLNLSMDLEWWKTAYHLSHFSAPVIFVFLTWVVSKNFVVTLEKAERLNKTLSKKLLTGQHELEKSYAVQQKLERHKRRQLERERIFSDLHDDLGARLLSLVYAAEDDTKADLARSTLQDLRDVVSRKPEDSRLLIDILADIHAEQEPRVLTKEKSFIWEQSEYLPHVTLKSNASITLRRLVRELIGNLMIHDEVNNINISFTNDEESLIISVQVADIDSTHFLDDERSCNKIVQYAEHLHSKVQINHEQQKTLDLRIALPLENLTDNFV